MHTRFRYLRRILASLIVGIILALLYILLILQIDFNGAADVKAEEKIYSIFGMAYNYDIEDLSPFVLSLRHTGYEGSLLFGVKFPISKKLKKFAGIYGITLKEVNPIAVDPSSLCSLGLASDRYFYYQKWLEEVDKSIAAILISDVRDVLFQTNPFKEFYPDNGFDIIVFEETFNFSINTRLPFKVPWNRNWIIEGYGNKELEKIGREVIICSGTTIATRKGIDHYLLKMTTELESFRKRCPTQNSCMCNESRGFDQGVHNFLIHNGRIKNVSKKRYGESLIFTLGSLRYTDHVIEQDDKGYVLNSWGNRVSVLHQYNRLSLDMHWVRRLIKEYKTKQY